jgi:hypothetical protein
MTRISIAAGFVGGVCAFVLAMQAGFAQTAPEQGTNVAAYVPTSLAAEPGLPRTPDGHPDFSGVVWAGSYFGMLEAVPGMLPPELVLSEEKATQAFQRMMAMFLGNPAVKKMIEADPEASALLSSVEGFPVVRGQRRTRLVVMPVDGKLPYTPEARKEASSGMGRMEQLKSDNPEDRTLGERCLTLGGQPPIAMMSELHPRQFFQTRDHIVIQSEYGEETRIARFSPTHRPAALNSLMGDSIARWEGDTLVIETTGFTEASGMRGAFPVGLLVRPDAKVIERFTRVSRDELLYQFTVEDPDVFTGPWLAEYSLFEAPFRLYPSSCHEGNASLPNILRGQRVADERAAGATRPLHSDPAAGPSPPARARP